MSHFTDRSNYMRTRARAPTSYQQQPAPNSIFRVDAHVFFVFLGTQLFFFTITSSDQRKIGHNFLQRSALFHPLDGWITLNYSGSGQTFNILLPKIFNPNAVFFFKSFLAKNLETGLKLGGRVRIRRAICLCVD